MKPILFNTEMVRQIIDGKKGVTRRLVKPQPKGTMALGICTSSTQSKDAGKYGFGTCAQRIDELIKPPFKVGDVLYVRETFAYSYDPFDDYFVYKADGDPCYPYFGKEYGDTAQVKRWLPSIHMPKEAARIFLKVTDVRVERLQDITVEQCKKEGAIDILLDRKHPLQPKIFEFAEWIESLNDWFVGPKDAFAALWNSTIDKADLEEFGWDANPYVFVIEFERCEKEDINGD